MKVEVARPGLPVSESRRGLCGRKATLEEEALQNSTAPCLPAKSTDFRRSTLPECLHILGYGGIG